MIRVKITIMFFMLLTTSIFSQVTIDQIFFDSSVQGLENEIYRSAQKHTLYSYNLSNANTPGFEPILFPEDEAELYSMVPKDSEYFQKVLLEHMTTSMARNRNEYAAYLALYKKKFEIYRQVATMGKK